MDLSDRVSEDVIKIFHNAKGSIFKDVIKWTEVLSNEQHKTYQIEKDKTHPVYEQHAVLVRLPPTEDIKQNHSNYNGCTDNR